MFRRFLNNIHIRRCHHITDRERLIMQLYRELGEYHLRDNNQHYHSILEKIHKLENPFLMDSEKSINETYSIDDKQDT